VALAISIAVLVIVIVIAIAKASTTRRNHSNNVQALLDARMEASRPEQAPSNGESAKPISPSHPEGPATAEEPNMEEN
jgi:hypothetical protein